MSAFDDLQRDGNRLRQRQDQADADRARFGQEDVVIEHPRRLFLRAPGGQFFRLSVTDAGQLVAEPAGNNPL